MERKSSQRFVPSLPAPPAWDEEWPDDERVQEVQEVYADAPAPVPTPQVTLGTCEIWCISPEGYECRLEMPVDGAGGMAAVLVELEAMGFTPRQPKAKPVSQPRQQPQRQQQPQPQQRHIPAPPPTDPSPLWCDDHGCEFKLFRKNDRSWWAHYDEAGGRWCNSPLPVRGGV